MKIKHLLAINAVSFSAFIFCSTLSHAAPPQYTVTDLGNLGGVATYATGLNVSGQVVGYSTTVGAGLWHGFLYSSGTITDLGTLGSPTSIASSLNGAGVIVGWSETEAFRYSGGSMADLIPGFSPNVAYAINDSGLAVGYVSVTAGFPLSSRQHAFVFSGGFGQDLGTLGGNQSVAYAINATGQIAGAAQPTGSTSFHAFRYTGSTMTDLGTFGLGNSAAYGINATGWVVGAADIDAFNHEHAFLYTGAALVDLGTLGGSQSRAQAINARGDIVGNAYTIGDAVYTAFLYTEGTMYELNALLPPDSGITFLRADGLGGILNDAGQIAAYGRIGDETHAFLLTPTPEPASAGLLLGGATLLGLRRRR